MNEYVDIDSVSSERKDQAAHTDQECKRDLNRIPSQRNHAVCQSQCEREQLRHPAGDVHLDRSTLWMEQNISGKISDTENIDRADDKKAVSAGYGESTTAESRGVRATGEGKGNVEREFLGHQDQKMERPDDWGEVTTAVTGTTSEAGYSVEDLSNLNQNLDGSIGFKCARYFGCAVAGILVATAYLSPVAMVILPKVNTLSWQTEPCQPECEGQLIGFTFKLIILALGSWGLFWRKPNATMPRILIFRAIVVLLIFILTVSYWLFYGLCILKVRDTNYPGIVSFCVSFVDSLLFIHYLAVILLEIRHIQPQFVIKVVRSPDGQSRSYTVGQLTIQQLAVWCLQQYYKDFEVYNPYLEHYTRRASRMSGFKIYSVDGSLLNSASGRSHAIFAAAGRQRDSGHNDRFYEEQEYERRLKKRKARLIVAAEEAFGHVKQLQQDKIGLVEIGPMETAQAIFPGLVKPLQKYLRVTRQQPRYSLDNIIGHLATCISHDMSAKAFTERYLTQGPVIWDDKDFASTQTWTISSSQLLNGSIQNGCIFRLQQRNVTLLVTIRKLSHFSLTEDILDQKKFAIRLSSETSV